MRPIVCKPLGIALLIAALVVLAIWLITLGERSGDARFFRDSQRALGLDAGPEP